MATHAVNHTYDTRLSSVMRSPLQKPQTYAATPLINVTPATLTWLWERLFKQGGYGAAATEPNKLAEMAQAWEKGLAQLKATPSGVEERRRSDTGRSRLCCPCLALGLLGLLLTMWWAFLNM
jgi:hypothetical protein